MQREARGVKRKFSILASMFKLKLNDYWNCSLAVFMPLLMKCLWRIIDVHCFDGNRINLLSPSLIVKKSILVNISRKIFDGKALRCAYAVNRVTQNARDIKWLCLQTVVCQISNCHLSYGSCIINYSCNFCLTVVLFWSCRVNE